jgi:hypothetical protein
MNPMLWALLGAWLCHSVALLILTYRVKIHKEMIILLRDKLMEQELHKFLNIERITNNVEKTDA